MAGSEIFISKKEEYDFKRQKKIRQSKRRLVLKSLKKVAVWITVVMTIIFTGAGIVISLRGAGSRVDVKILKDYLNVYAIQGRDHIAIGSSHPEYNSNPPTSGWHYEKEAEWGIYDEELPDEQLVHNLEHCGVWISYQPTISSETKDKLLSFARRFPSKMIVTPRARNDSAIALASWGVLLKLPDYREDLMTAFVTSFLNRNGPECNAN